MEKPFVLLIDTTVLYSGIAYNGLENKVLNSGEYLFYTTEFTIAEVCWLLTTKRKFSLKRVVDVIKSLPIVVVKADFIRDGLEEGRELIGHRDESDVPLVALALTLHGHDGIWSSDKDFEEVDHIFKIWRTRELING